MLQHRDLASAGVRRPGGGGSRREKDFSLEMEMAATDAGPLILTRAELQRRTRERSRLAARKIAEEHGKVGMGLGQVYTAVVLGVLGGGGRMSRGGTRKERAGRQRQRERGREREARRERHQSSPLRAFRSV